MHFDFVAATHAGQVRENNEDAVQVDALHGVAVLADGMGGYNAGEIASAMAAAYVCTELTRWLVDRGQRATAADKQYAMQQFVGQANLSIYNASLANPHFSGMGTTVVVALFDEAGAYIAHVGDSRCYLLRDGALKQLTRDHSLLQEQLDAGLITPELAKIATHRNLVTRAMGVDPDLAVDIQVGSPQVGDLYCLCSDGLSDMLDDAVLQQLLCADTSLTEKAGLLVQAANLAGGRDNISVILVQAKAKSASAGFFSRIMHPHGLD